MTHWYTAPELWEKLRPLAQQMRRSPTPAENQLWYCLRDRQLLGMKFRRQHTIERFILDFYCAEAKLAVEVDGAVHEYTVEEDAIRQEFLENQGIMVLRFTNDQVMLDTENVAADIALALEKRSQKQGS